MSCGLIRSHIKIWNRITDEAGFHRAWKRWKASCIGLRMMQSGVGTAISQRTSSICVGRVVATIDALSEVR